MWSGAVVEHASRTVGEAVENSPKVGFSVGVVEWNVDGGVEPRLLWTKTV